MSYWAWFLDLVTFGNFLLFVVALEEFVAGVASPHRMRFALSHAHAYIHARKDRETRGRGGSPYPVLTLPCYLDPNMNGARTMAQG